MLKSVALATDHTTTALLVGTFSPSICALLGGPGACLCLCLCVHLAGLRAGLASVSAGLCAGVCARLGRFCHNFVVAGTCNFKRVARFDQ